MECDESRKANDDRRQGRFHFSERGCEQAGYLSEYLCGSGPTDICVSPPDFTLVAISGLEWDHDMAPWDIPPISKKDTPCTGGADSYLGLLLSKIIPEAEKQISGTPVWRGDCGLLPRGIVCRLRHVSNRRVFKNREYVRLPLVPRNQGIHLLPRGKAKAGLPIFLSGRQGKQNAESISEMRSAEHRANRSILSGQGDRYCVLAESRQSFSRRGSAKRRRDSMDFKQMI